MDNNPRTQPYDVLVVGNGVLGSSLAIRLAHRGVRVGLIGEPDRPFAASSAAGAMLGAFGEVTSSTTGTSIGRHKFALDLEAKQEWPDWLAFLSDDRGDPEDLITARGTTVLLNTVGTAAVDSRNFSAIMNALQTHDEPHELVDVEDLPWLDPDETSRPLRAVHIPREHAVDSARLLCRLTERAVYYGVDIIEGEALAVEHNNGSRATGVRLRDGTRLSAGQIVLASGVGCQDLVDSVPGLSNCIPRLIAGYGVSAQVTTHDGTQPDSVIRTPNRAFACGLHVIPRGRGRVYLGGTNILSPKPLADPAMRDLVFLLECSHRQLRRNLWSSPVVDVQVGNRPVSLDGNPLLGETPLPGLWMMTGTYREGLFLSPVLSEQFADLLTEGTSRLDLSPFTPERAPLEDRSRSEIVATTVEHALATGYEDHWRIPTHWQDVLDADLEPIYAAWADDLDQDFTPPPELLSSSRIHPIMADWLRAYYDRCRDRFGPPSADAPAVGDLIADAATTLRQALVWDPAGDAEALMAHVLSVPRDRLDARRELTHDERSAFSDAVRLRSERHPLEYITGTAEFLGLRIQVGDGVFILRLHSEGLICDALKCCGDGPLQVLDLCCGSGALGLAVATQRPGSQVVGVDASAVALNWAEDNVANYAEQLEGSMSVMEGDVADPTLLADHDGSCDLVLANPPYVPSQDQVRPEWALHQPGMAVYSGMDGLGLLDDVLRTASRLLKSGGVLALEHHDHTTDNVLERVRSYGFVDTTSHRDHEGFPRYMLGRSK